jgi:hypothetical protein
VILEGRRDEISGLEVYRKSLCCHYNMALDAYISNYFEPYRTGNRILNRAIYGLISGHQLFCRCLNPFTLSDFIESFSEPSTETSSQDP